MDNLPFTNLKRAKRMQSVDMNWSDMPMGPNWQTLLGLTQADMATKVSDERHQEFQTYLADFLDSEKVTSQELFINLLEELVGMKYPDLAQRFIRNYPDYFAREDFRCVLTAGIAALMTGDLASAETYLREAQILVPEEPAPYVNLCQLFWQDGRMEDGLIWARAGLDSDKNHQRLWELMAVFLRAQNEATYVDEIQREAKKRSSWAGLSLAADLINDRDPFLKSEWLKELYDRGERGEGFLIELTAAMGAAGQYKDLLDVISSEQAQAEEVVSWQLILHKVQGHLGLEDLKSAESDFVILERHRELPKDLSPMLTALKTEINDSIAELNTKDRT